jgi:hypothetical protein
MHVDFLEVKLSPGVIKHHAMNTWGSGGIATPFLTSALDVDEWSASRPSRFTPIAHCVDRVVAPRADLNAFLPLPGT